MHTCRFIPLSKCFPYIFKVFSHKAKHMCIINVWQLQEDVIMRAIDLYKDNLKVFGHITLPRYYQPKSFNERMDHLLVMLCRQCTKLHTLVSTYDLLDYFPILYSPASKIPVFRTFWLIWTESLKTVNLMKNKLCRYLIRSYVNFEVS